MTVKVHLRHRQPRRRAVVWLEYLLLFAGLVAVDCYIWFNVDTVVYQAYQNWSMDQQLAGRQPSVGAFVADKLKLPWLGVDALESDNSPSARSTVDANRPNQPKTVKVQPLRRRLPTFALVGRVGVPRLGLSAIVREGVDDKTLRFAVGHMPSTALPGDYGNVALAAHRDTLFRKLRDIRKDDRITMEAADGTTYDYEVESMKIVKPSDVSVLKAGKDERVLTLITCYPFNYIGSAPNRFIVRARQTDVSADSGLSRSPSGSSASRSESSF